MVCQLQLARKGISPGALVFMIGLGAGSAYFGLKTIVSIRDKLGHSKFAHGRLGKKTEIKNAKSYRETSPVMHQTVGKLTFDVLGTKLPAEAGDEVVVEYLPGATRIIAIAVKSPPPS